MRPPFILRCLTLTLALLPFATRSAGGQRVISTVDLGGSVVRYSDSVSSSAATFSPALRLDGDRFTVGVVGTVSQSVAGWSGQSALQTSLFTPAAGVLLGELTGSVGGSAHGTGPGTGQALAVARAHVMSAQRGAWGGIGAGSMWNGVAARPVRVAEVAAWTYVGSAMALASLTPISLTDSIRYTDAELAVRFDTPRVEVGVAAGTRSGGPLPASLDDTRAWATASLTGWISSRAALVAGVGSYPADLMQGLPGGRFVSLGLRFGPRTSHRDHTASGAPAYAALEASGAAAVRASPITNESVLELRFGEGSTGRRTVRVHAPRATAVELMGDFTGWEPVRLVPAGGGWWTVALPIEPGVHQLNVRASGGRWAVPPGLTTATDEFGGSVGVLVLP